MPCADPGSRVATDGTRLQALNPGFVARRATGRTLVVAATIIATLLPGAAAHAGEALNFCYEMADVRPWRTTTGAGLNFELIDSAARRVGVVIKFHGLPWKRCLTELKASAMDGALAASFKADRLSIGAYPGGETPDASKRLHVDRYVVAKKKGTPVQWNGKAFQSLDGAVGIQLGYSVGEQLTSLKVPVDDGSLTLRELLLKLLAGRIGAAAVLASEMEYLAKQDTKLAAQIDILSIPLVEKPYYLILSHHILASNPALADRLWKAIEQERNSPAYRKAEKNAMAGGLQ